MKVFLIQTLGVEFVGTVSEFHAYPGHGLSCKVKDVGHVMKDALDVQIESEVVDTITPGQVNGKCFLLVNRKTFRYKLNLKLI